MALRRSGRGIPSPVTEKFERALLVVLLRRAAADARSVLERAELAGAMPESSAGRRIAAVQRSEQCEGAFVAVLAKERFVHAALCWHNQLRRVGTTCRILLILDDRPRAPVLSNGSWSKLVQTFGNGSLVRVSSLAASTGLGGRHGRRLLDRGRAAQTAAALKYWAWALSVPRVCYMDLDVLIKRNVDDLLQWALPRNASLAAVRCPGRSFFFNSGVMLLRPSRDFLRRLLLRDCYWVSRHFANATHDAAIRPCRRYTNGPVRGQDVNTVKACESRLADQSIINMAVQTDYAGRTGRKQGRVAFLPTRYNAGWSTSAARASDVAIVHFAGTVSPFRHIPHSRDRETDTRRLPSVLSTWQETANHGTSGAKGSRKSGTICGWRGRERVERVCRLTRQSTVLTEGGAPYNER